MTETLAAQYMLEGSPDGPFLVLSSSLGTTHEMWDPQLPFLVDRVQLIRYDHPGHGASPVPVAAPTIADLGLSVLAMLDRLGTDRVSFCGISLGGCVGMWLAAHAPSRIDRLVLACTSPRFGTADGWNERAATVREHGVEAIADATIERWFTPEFPHRDAYRDMLVSTPAEGYARCCEALADFDAHDLLERIEAPTLVIHGVDDPSVSRDDVDTLTGRIPDSRLVELPARHLASAELPEEFAAAVLEHVAA